MVRFLDEANRQFGSLDGLINNAAVGQDSLLVTTSEESIHKIVETNLIATLNLTRLFLRRLFAERRAGRVVMITSICAQRGYPGLAVYAATKGGLESATRALAREYRERLAINCVAPGFFGSEMSASLGQEQLESIARRTPTGKLVDTRDILPVVRSLILEQTNLNGQVLTVDGGASA